ncbi:DUF2127 domain-containing protein [Sorangium sp. So ce1097]|uniref:DUF2127 domain-containing protein n=1 Tax=Sorangium sp. So ce1097 TaxID=3133330 RepID=UPI003F5E158A
MLRLIAAFKLIKATLLTAVGLGALRLLGHDVASELRSWLQAMSLDPDNRQLHRLLALTGAISDRKLEELAAGTFVYAAVFLVEGIGLMCEKRWAEVVTVAVTTSLLPFELYEIVLRATIPRLSAMVINVAAVVYLIARLRAERAGQGTQRGSR